MFNQFEALLEKFNDIERQLSDPEVISDQKKYQSFVKKHAELKEGVALYQRFKKINSELKDARTLLKDPAFSDLAKQEIQTLEEESQALQKKLELFLIPPDPHDKKNAVVEIRAGTGGEEAALFAYDLFRMYTRYAERVGWKIDILSENITGLNGIKEVVFVLSGSGAYSKLKYEIGTHRVQRVPETEASGRIHTSAATVAVLPELEDIEIKIDPKDLRIDTFRSSGAGGQHVNRTDSAVRITHIPTGIVAACQNERSQFQNKDKALRMLRTKFYEIEVENQRKKEAQSRKNQVGSGDRSEKIRTYNFPQNRVTDHRIQFTSHNLEEFLNGDIESLITALISADHLAKMKQ